TLTCERPGGTHPRVKSEGGVAGKRYVSTFVRPAHQLQGRFDVPPNLGLLVIALIFEGASLLSGLDNGLVAVRFQQLPGVVLDFDFLHSHGVMLLFFSATERTNRARTVGVDTYQEPT